MRFILTALLCLAGPAFAGDRATPYFLGFSPSGHYAAFEEYGVQDGSGFAYSTITFLNTRTDEWVGTPVAVLEREDAGGAGVARAREAAHAKAQPEMERLQIAPRGRMVAWAGSDEMPAHLNLWEDRLGPVALTVSAFGTDAACDYDAVPIQGFTLDLIEASGATIDRLHEDTRVPASRVCPRGYGLASVHVLSRASLGPVIVALIAYERLGFEGPDRRHLAVAKTYDRTPH